MPLEGQTGDGGSSWETSHPWTYINPPVKDDFTSEINTSMLDETLQTWIVFLFFNSVPFMPYCVMIMNHYLLFRLLIEHYDHSCILIMITAILLYIILSIILVVTAILEIIIMLQPLVPGFSHWCQAASAWCSKALFAPLEEFVRPERQIQVTRRVTNKPLWLLPIEYSILPSWKLISNPNICIDIVIHIP